MLPHVDFEVTLLRLIWQGSLLLACLSISTMFLLMIERVWENHRALRLKERTEQLFKRILISLNLPALRSQSTKFKLERGDKFILCNIFANILRVVRGQDVVYLVQMLQDYDIIPYLYKALRNSRRGQRIQILTILSYLQDQESLLTLLNYIADKNPYVRLAALHGLAERGAVAYLPQILKTLIDLKLFNTPLLAHVLEQFGGAGVPSLLAFVKSDSVIEMRIEALKALSGIGSLQAVEPLILLASDPEVDIRARALAALGKIGDIRASEIILKRLHDKEQVVRIQAAKAAGAMKLQAALSPLINLMNDETWWVRYRATEALCQLGDLGISLLRVFSTHENTAAADSARQILIEKKVCRNE